MVSKNTLEKMTVAKLAQYCRNYNIKGYAGKKKSDIINVILDFYEPGKRSKQIKIKLKGKFINPPKTKIINGKKYRRNPKFSYSSIERAEAYAKLLNKSGKNTVIDSYKQKSSDGKNIYTYYFYWIEY